MGTRGYELALEISYRTDEIILEVGAGESTSVLSRAGVPLVSIDVDAGAWCGVDVARENMMQYVGMAEDVLVGWNRQIGFAWLDGWDWPYAGNSLSYYDEQRDAYNARDQVYSQVTSRVSHKRIAQLIADYARVIAFDDTWQTHRFASSQLERCRETVPPATPPAPQLAMNEPYDRSICDLPADHPHHNRPGVGWNGKGGDAVPYLLERGFNIIENGLCLVALERN